MKESIISLQQICAQLGQWAPLRLAESWDNVGLLVGDRDASVRRVMTCLTISPPIVSEAVERGVDLIVTHHPLPFKALQKITSDNVVGSMLLKLMQAGVAIYSAHTAFDSAESGINQQWAERIGLSAIEPLIPREEPEADPGLGAGRLGILPEPRPLNVVVETAARSVGAKMPRLVGNGAASVQRIAFACGSGGSFLSAARRRGCDALITGEATFHTCLEAEAFGIGLGLLGHFWSERFAMDQLAERIAEEFDSIEVWASESECDPVTPLSFSP